MYLRIFFYSLFFIFSTAASAQVGIGTVDPDPSSILDVNSSTQGVLIPRMTTAERNAIANPVQGLMVFDTDVNSFHFFDGSSWVRIVSAESVSDYTGWGDYVDTQYTTGSPFILGASSTVTLPNNAGTVRDAQKPNDITTFYDASSQTITGRDGDMINIVIEFKARPNSSSVTRLTVSIDIGGAVGEIYKRDFVLAKGNNEEHFYLSSFTAYTLGTWQANGGAVKIRTTASTDIYDVRYVISRIHKAR